MKKQLLVVLALGSISAFAGKCNVQLKGRFPVYFGNLAEFTRVDLDEQQCYEFAEEMHQNYFNDHSYGRKAVVRYWEKL